MGCKECVYSVIEDIDKAYGRCLSIQMDFVLTARMYCYFVSYFSGIQEVFISLQSVLTKPRNEGIIPGVTR